MTLGKIIKAIRHSVHKSHTLKNSVGLPEKSQVQQTRRDPGTIKLHGIEAVLHRVEVVACEEFPPRPELELPLSLHDPLLRSQVLLSWEIRLIEQDFKAIWQGFPFLLIQNGLLLFQKEGH